jgi:hypothetical protein
MRRSSHRSAPHRLLLALCSCDCAAVHAHARLRCGCGGYPVLHARYTLCTTCCSVLFACCSVLFACCSVFLHASSCSCMLHRVLACCNVLCVCVVSTAISPQLALLGLGQCELLLRDRPRLCHGTGQCGGIL